MQGLYSSLIVYLSIQGFLVRCDHNEMSIIDLSYPFDDDTLVWPGNDPFRFEILSRGLIAGGHWYESNKIQMEEHTGTHMDAPAHFAEGKQRIGDIPTDKLVGPGIKIDITSKASANRDAQLDIDDLMAWEQINGQIPDGSILMVYTGWGQYYPNRTAYFGSERNDTFLDSDGNSLLHFPGISAAVADWLIENRDVSGVGIDTPSIDYGQSTDFPTHLKLYSRNIFGLENVANLDKMSSTGSTIYALPMKIQEGSGAPVRIISIAEESTNGSSEVGYLSMTSVLFAILVNIINRE